MEEISLINVVKEIVHLCSSQLVKLIELAHLEVQLTSRTISCVVVLSFFISAFLVSTWLSVLTLMFFGLRTFEISVLFSLLIVVAINFMALLSAVIFLIRMKENFFFKATRRQITAFFEKSKEGAHEHSDLSNSSH